MPVGKFLIDQVAAVLGDEPAHIIQIRGRLVGTYSSRAIRYAMQALVKQGRAKVKWKRGHYVACKEPE